MILTASAARVFRDLAHWAGGRLWLLFLVMVVAGLAEVVSILLLVPLVSLADGNFDWSAAVGIADPLAGYSPTSRLLLVVAAFVAIMMLRALLSLAREKRQSQLDLGYEQSLRARLMAGVVERGWSRGAAMGESSLQTLLIAETSRASVAAQQGLVILTSGALLAIQGLAAFVLSPGLSLIAAGAVGLLVLIGLPFARASHRKGAEVGVAHQRSGEESGKLIQGLKTASAEGRTEAFMERWRQSDRALFDDQRLLAMQAARVRTSLNFLLALFAAILLLVGRIGLNLPLVVLLPLLLLLARLAGPARQIVNASQTMVAYAPAFDRLAPHLANEGPDVRDGGRLPAEPLRWTRLSANGLTYRPVESFGLGPVDFEIKAGEWVGLSGASGSGKTSLIDCLAGLQRPDGGALHLDGTPIDLVANPRWAAQLSYVGQGEALYGGTLRDLLGLDAARADEAERRLILDHTGVSRIVAQLSGGLDTALGSRAALLSGGEAARVAIARGLLRRPALLILDEATAPIDVDNERALLDGLRRLPFAPAIVMVAHRAQSLERMDRVIALDSGKILLNA